MPRCIPPLLIMSLALFQAACTSNGQRIDRLAESAGLTKSAIDADGYRSLIYMKRGTATNGAALLVFIEGDGRPWDGLQPSADPTTRNPIALKLLLQTPRSGAYITRPCYQNLQGKGCTPERWTAARYSEEVIASMAAAVREAARAAAASEVILVGYSGGGSLAVLVAERIDNVIAVVTVAANLDTDAWVGRHRFLVSQSLNPATSERAHPWREIHLHGARDNVVPVSTTAAYFVRHPNARQQVIEQYDHVCCWVENWPALYASIEKEWE